MATENQHATKASDLGPLFDAVQAQIEAGTFSLEAVNRIADLRQRCVTLDEKNAVLTQELTDTRGRLTRLGQDLETLRNTAGDLDRREKAVRDAEITIAVDRKELELTRAHKDDMKGLLQTALRSPIVQKTMTDNVMVPVSNGCSGFVQAVTKSETSTEI